MEVPMTMHSDHHVPEAASDGTMESIYMVGALSVVAVIALWYFS
jgi:hypothetical protein